jgi:hypothetical protein
VARRSVRVLGLTDVTLYADRLLAQMFCRGTQFGLAAPGDEDVRTLVDETLSGGQPDTGGAARDDGRLASE